MLLAVLAIGFILRSSLGHGGSSTPAGDRAIAGTSSSGVNGGTLVEGDVGAPTSLNPLLASSPTEQDLAALMFDGLVRVDGTGTPRPDLAREWKISADGLTYTISLRKDVTWHDGQPFTAQDVRFTVGLLQSSRFPGDPQLAQFWRPIVVDTPDDATVVFHLLAPFSPFMNSLSLPILPKHLLGGVVAGDLTLDRFNDSPVGTGPFSFASWDAARKELKLKAFSGYFGERPQLSEITFRYYDDSGSLLSALRSGEVQASGTLPADDALRTGALAKQDSIFAPVTMSYTALFLNTRASPFSDPIVRQAIQLAVNPSVLTDGPLKSQAVAGNGPIPPSSWAFAPVERPVDPQRAAALLEKNGWKFVDKDGDLEKGDERLAFQILVNSDDPQRMLMAQTIAQQLAAIHVRAEVQATTSSAVRQALATRQFSAAIFGGRYPNGDPDCYDAWGSAQSTSGLNVTGIADSTIDKALREARNTADLNARRDLYTEFQREFASQVPAVVLYYPRYLFVVSNEVHGVTPDPIINPSDRFQQIAHWYVSSYPARAATP